jgi:soluble lytic murein transglycosylase-like protein
MISRFFKAILLIIFAGTLWAFYRALHVEQWLNSAFAAPPIVTIAAAKPNPSFTPEVQHWWLDIQNWARQYNLDPDLVATIMQIESCGDPNAVSSSGAQGLFQVMPFHFTPAAPMRDPATNAQAGLTFLTSVIDQARGDVNLAMAAYNGGQGVIDLPIDQWADETRRYYYWGSGIYAESKRGSSARLQEWLQAGGAVLCQQAAQSLQIKSN